MTKLYEANNHILIQTGSLQPAEHSHMAAHIILSMDGSMKVQCAGAEYLCHGILVPSGISHAVDTQGNAVLVFLYDCTTEVAKQIREVTCIPGEICKEIVQLYADMESVSDSYYGFEKAVLSRLRITGAATNVTDDRIQTAMEFIRAKSTEKVTCRYVADAVHLSQSRFSHLFREQVGMTFAAYLIYQRIMYVYTQMLRGRSITEAALEAGFSSSAHFADVNRRVFGISASTITHDLEFIKVQ
jgi:AraC-like DNA-binding protein